MSSYFSQIATHEGKVQYPYATSKVVCVGRNYREHAAELNNPVPQSPLLFIKSTNTLVDLSKPFDLPHGSGDCHHELEIALLIGKPVSQKTDFEKSCIAGVGIALDLTLRDLQSSLKSKGHPWERAKSFDGACPVSEFIPTERFADLQKIDFSMKKNGLMVQQGNSQSMIFSIKSLIQSISACFSLYPGDIVLTGTPKGVAKLTSGDQLAFRLADQLSITTQVN